METAVLTKIHSCTSRRVIPFCVCQRFTVLSFSLCSWLRAGPVLSPFGPRTCANLCLAWEASRAKAFASWRGRREAWSQAGWKPPARCREFRWDLSGLSPTVPFPHFLKLIKSPGNKSLNIRLHQKTHVRRCQYTETAVITGKSLVQGHPCFRLGQRWVTWVSWAVKSWS